VLCSVVAHVEEVELIDNISLLIAISELDDCIQFKYITEDFVPTFYVNIVVVCKESLWCVGRLLTCIKF
jgi:hypothetical protein